VSSDRDEIDPLEAELAAMRPAEPSPELYAAVGRALARRSWTWRVIAWLPPIGAAAAVAAAVTVALRHRPPGVLPPTPRVVVAPPTLPATGADPDRPALANYRGAAELSAAELDDLLDRHAARSLVPGNAVHVTARAGAMSGIGMP
jgi:hypothetical protein